MLEIVVVALIVALAAGVLGVRLLRAARGPARTTGRAATCGSGCGCSCDRSARTERSDCHEP